MQPACNHMNQNILAPAMFERGTKIPLARRTVLDPIQNPRIMAPGQFCNELLQNLRLRPRLGETPHITQVAGTEALHSGELRLEVSGQPVHDLRSPALPGKPGAEVTADRPVKQHQFVGHGEGGAHLGRPDAGFELGEQLWVARRDADLDTGRPGHGSFASDVGQFCNRLLQN